MRGIIALTICCVTVATPALAENALNKTVIVKRQNGACGGGALYTLEKVGDSQPVNAIVCEEMSGAVSTAWRKFAHYKVGGEDVPLGCGVDSGTGQKFTLHWQAPASVPVPKDITNPASDVVVSTISSGMHWMLTNYHATKSLDVYYTCGTRKDVVTLQPNNQTGVNNSKPAFCQNNGRSGPVITRVTFTKFPYQAPILCNAIGDAVPTPPFRN